MKIGIHKDCSNDQKARVRLQKKSKLKDKPQTETDYNVESYSW